jgi:hypothetical protein
LVRETSDTEQAREAAARRFFEAIDFTRYWEAILHDSAKSVPDTQRQRFFRLVPEVMPAADVRRTIFSMYVKHFSPGQLDAMTRFYGPPEGRRVLYKSARNSGPPEASEGSGDTSEDRRVAAQRYFATVDMKRLYGDTGARDRKQHSRRYPTRGLLEEDAR